MAVQPAHEDFRTGIRLNPLKKVAAFVTHPVDGNRAFHRLHGISLLSRFLVLAPGVVRA
jgi:hypothetical protein